MSQVKVTTLMNADGSKQATANDVIDGTAKTKLFSPFSLGMLAGVDAAALRTSMVAAKSGANGDITSLTGLTTPLSIAQGGTGATTDATARSALGIIGRNRVINGDCRVAQRGSAVVTGTINLWGGPDRFRATMQAAGGQFTQTLSSFGDLNGVTRNWIAQTCNSSATNLAGTNYWSGIAHAIEGTNCFDLRGQPVSLSFLFRSNITGVFSVALRDASTWSYVTIFSVTANTTTKIVINIPAIPLAASVPAGNGIGLGINIGAVNNGTFNTATINAWQNSVYLAANAATQWQATPGTYIAVTDLQLEQGMDTEFERIPYSDQLARCQRYYEVVPGTVNAGQGIYVWRYYKVSKRAVPTLGATGSFGGANLESSSDYGFRLGGTAPTSDADFTVFADSEL